MVVGSSRFEAAFQLLTVGRWDHAFDVVWNASKAAKVVSDTTQGQPLIVSDSGNHTLAVNSRRKWPTALRAQSVPGLQIAWQMLASDLNRPEAIIKFAPQLAFVFEAEGKQTISPTNYALSVQSLNRWLEAAEGGFRGSKHSMFTMQLTGPEKAPKPADALPNYTVALIPPPDRHDEPPGIPQQGTDHHCQRCRFKN